MTTTTSLAWPDPARSTLGYACDADNAAGRHSATDGADHAAADLCVLAAGGVAVSFTAKCVGTARTAIREAAVASQKEDPQ